MVVVDLMIQSVINNWNQTIPRLNTLFGGVAETEWQEEIASGRNRAIYILGHLTAVHDQTLEVLGFGIRNHPELDDAFIKNPDRVVETGLSAAELNSFWREVNGRLEDGMSKLSPEQWIGRHRAVSEEDYAKNPIRNCLSVVLSRINHADYHLGQLMLWRRRRG